MVLWSVRMACLGAALLALAAAASAAPVPVEVEITDLPDQSVVSGPTDVSGTSALRDLNDDGWVVIATPDTGINPYHEDFVATPDQPGSEAEPMAPGKADPATYIAGYPAGTPDLELKCKATNDIPNNCRSDFVSASVEQLYWIPGTKIIGAISFDPATAGAGSTPILDEHMHGTMVASLAAGNVYGACPKCLVVAVEGLSYEAIEWALQQPWIDIVSVSAGFDLRAGAPTWAAAEPPAGGQPFVESGGSLLFAAGNGWANMFVTPQNTHVSPLAGPDWHMVIGAVDAATGESVMGSGKPVTASSFGSGPIPIACHDSRKGECNGSGTSAATPFFAGILGNTLREARMLLDDTGVGPRGTIGGQGVAAQGTPVPGNQYLDDGRLTRQELWAIALRTTDQLTPGTPLTGGGGDRDYTYVGYGVGTFTSRDRAALAVICGDDLPSTPDRDAFLQDDSDLRQARWGDWAEPKFDFTIGTDGGSPCTPQPPPADPMPELSLTVNGLMAGTVIPEPDGSWKVQQVDFGNTFPLSADGTWEVKAHYGTLEHNVTYLPRVPQPILPLFQVEGTCFTYQFQDRSKTDGEVALTAWAWSFGDLSMAEGPAPVHTYEAPGHYIVTLTVQDGLDRTATAMTMVEVRNCSTQPDLLGDPTLDTDMDGVPDGRDDCPGTPNRDQQGCVQAAALVPVLRPDDDADRDGHSNAVDNCPLIKNPGQGDLDLDGDGDACDADADGDGVPQVRKQSNQIDNCPTVPNPAQADHDGNGVGDRCDLLALAAQGGGPGEASLADGASASSDRTVQSGREGHGAALLGLLALAIIAGVLVYWTGRRAAESD